MTERKSLDYGTGIAGRDIWRGYRRDVMAAVVAVVRPESLRPDLAREYELGME